MRPHNWLFLRGLVREKRHWADFPERFHTALPNQRVFCLDLPGVGTESSRPSPITVPQIRAEIRNRWLELKASQGDGASWALFTISLGSMVGMNWVEAHPEDFTSLVLINPSAGNLNLPWKRLQWRILPRLLAASLNRDPVAREREILRLTTALHSKVDVLAREWGTYVAERAQLRATGLRQLLAAGLFRAPVTLPVPALLLSSAQDGFTHPDCSLVLARHLGLAQHIHPRAGHDLPLDDPDWIIAKVKSFIELLD